MNSNIIDNLVKTLKILPGIGPKSAQRITFFLLRNKQIGIDLYKSLNDVMLKVNQCVMCFNFTTESICSICSNQERLNYGQICIVENPADVFAIEQTGQFSGVYFILFGCLSPIDGIKSSDINLDILENRLKKNIIKEVIIATSSTVEGEITSNYIAGICKNHNIIVSRIAYGIPVGSEIESIDFNTLSHSIIRRYEINY
ncbi:MAG: recombination mediator RecR [Candidatus Lightella neohaematopini]|nr:recombination mediator RecR [Candidatus Lightella neohaematopini]MCV2531003.1 recombination mediator RecR [Candidatus Lightella neohaematopini]